MQSRELLDAQPRPIQRQPSEMVGVVPVAQVLKHQDEVRRSLDHPRDVDMRRLYRRTAGHVPVERQLTLVAAEQLLRARGLGLGG